MNKKIIVFGGPAIGWNGRNNKSRECFKKQNAGSDRSSARKSNTK